MAKRIKHEAALMLARLVSYGTWEDIPQSMLSSIREEGRFKQLLDNKLEEDKRLIWRAPPRFELANEQRKRFVIKTPSRATVVQLKAGKGAPKAPKAPPPPPPEMPQHLNGKMLSAHDRNSKQLCVLFQTGRCLNGKECEEGSHQCAVLL